MGSSKLEISDSILGMLNELAVVENASVQTVLERAVDSYRRNVSDVNSSKAPDGRPWPEGYFDRTPRMTFEAALGQYGVRPNHYHKGWPVYTDAEASLPEFRSPIADEPAEVQEYWNAQWEKWEAKRNAEEGSSKK